MFIFRCLPTYICSDLRYAVDCIVHASKSHNEKLLSIPSCHLPSECTVTPCGNDCTGHHVDVHQICQYNEMLCLEQSLLCRWLPQQQLHVIAAQLIASSKHCAPFGLRLLLDSCSVKKVAYVTSSFSPWSLSDQTRTSLHWLKLVSSLSSYQQCW